VSGFLTVFSIQEAILCHGVNKTGTVRANIEII